MKPYATTGFYYIAASLLSATILLSGCGTKVYRDNPALQAASDVEPANVYFIRPAPVKYKGIADSPLTVDYKGDALLKISEGSYTMVKIQPGKGEITTHSKTWFTNKRQPIEVSRSRKYDFLAGRTYFIHLKRVNDEFRGITYDPEPVNLQTAKTLSENLRKWGAASQQPIAKIEQVPPIPKASPLEPLYPEEVYPHSPYILDKPEKQ
ncbi:MAG: hypothetical protein LJE85_03685 [Gammaproteobacteria bacterium]|jgi:hypothetical protein|nr:hypothetical protein [Gammaproteobacteria bacterium]